ncbi:LacI family DNA-binding transcriptional regulator [Streptomyces sp. NPDC058417]|uniref:LacI family DNA-binding transcriptional regulator n=1 Tax=unclassified Streptomyces TaxID=2593676 RepID=UPI003666F216
MPSTPRRLTLSDVAERVGVSAKTVSRVLNGEGPVSEQTRERVLTVTRELGFHRDLMARTMRIGSRDSTVGLVVPEIGNPFFGAVAGGIEEATRERGLTLIMGSSEESVERENSLIATFLARRVSMLMVVPAVGGDHRYLRRERTGGLPLVFLDRPATGLTTDCVVSANRTGAALGTSHLIAHGHRRIAFLGDGPSTLFTRRERFRGYRDALDEAGLPHRPELLAEGHSPEAAAGAMARLLALPEPPTAVLAGNNFATVGVVKALAQADRRDVALVGFDDPMLGDVLRPGLTVVAQDPAVIGATAARLALARLDGTRTAAVRETIPVRLVPRGSGEIAPPPE